MTDNDNKSAGALAQFNWQWLVPAVLIFAAMLFVYREGLSLMVGWWEKKEEYNHGYLNSGRCRVTCCCCAPTYSARLTCRAAGAV